MSDLYIPDVSEYQGAIDWARLAAACPAVIIRLHNGYRLDTYGVANRSGAHAHGCRAVGLYQYLPAAVDPATAAHELCDAIGSLDPGEWPILDLEEGTGDQSGRARTWYATVAGRLHDGPAEELYSGEYFFRVHNLAATPFTRRWLAAYGAGEPSEPHELWQFTDSRAFPGISGQTDASVFHGTITDLLAHITPEDPMPTAAEVAQAVWEYLVDDATKSGVQAVPVKTQLWNATAAIHQMPSTLLGTELGSSGPDVAVALQTAIAQAAAKLVSIQLAPLTAQVAALSSALGALAKEGGMTAEQVQSAAKAGADEALAEIGKALAAAAPAGAAPTGGGTAAAGA